MAVDFDVVVIGSGFGGAVAACRLAEAGYDVLVLERGRRWEKKDYPRELGDAWIWDNLNPQKEYGWIDFRLFPGMGIMQGAGVGGGSLIYSGISVDAKPDLFQTGWPKEITYQELAPYYQQVGKMLGVEKLPMGQNQLPARTKLMREAAQKAGYGDQFDGLDLAISFDPEWNYDLPDPHNEEHARPFLNAQGVEQYTCIHLTNCNIGCDVHAKNSLDLNYLPLAEGHGAEIRPLHIVRTIQPLPEKSAYRIDYERIQNGTMISGSISARIVIVAAGSLGSTELLLRNRWDSKTLPSISKRLGRGWSSNGDLISFAQYPHRNVDPSHGPITTGVIDFLGPRNLDGQHFFIEDIGFPDLLRNYIREVEHSQRGNIFVRGLLQALQEAENHHAEAGMEEHDVMDHFTGWFAQGRDAGDGRMRLRRKWWLFGEKILDLKWNSRRSRALIDAIRGVHEEMTRLTDGNFIWSFDKFQITTHPLGGCNIGSTPKDGVVDHKGEVFGYKNLYVADGAILPEAIGANPSKTIAALSERIAKIIIDEGR
jgi:cholesterol oxidase